jgi:hypothetical protein
LCSTLLAHLARMHDRRVHWIESTLHRDLGLTLCRDGQIERGAEELRKALALNLQDRDAAKALEAIRVLNKTE